MCVHTVNYIMPFLCFVFALDHPLHLPPKSQMGRWAVGFSCGKQCTFSFSSGCSFMLKWICTVTSRKSIRSVQAQAVDLIGLFILCLSLNLKSVFHDDIFVEVRTDTLGMCLCLMTVRWCVWCEAEGLIKPPSFLRCDLAHVLRCEECSGSPSVSHPLQKTRSSGWQRDCFIYWKFCLLLTVLTNGRMGGSVINVNVVNVYHNIYFFV